MSEHPIVQALRAIVVELTRPFTWHALVRYRVVANADGRVVLQVVNRQLGLPDVLPISMVPGLPGGSGTPTPGAVVLVSFIEGDPSQPIVTHFAPTSDAAFRPLKVALDADDEVAIGEHATVTKLGGGSTGVARFGDNVVAGPFGGTIISSSTRVRAS